MKKTLGRKRLSESEWQVMKVFWGKGPMALRDVVQELDGANGWTYGTVKTLVNRMAGKGWLSTQRVGNSYLYSPAVKKSRAIDQALQEFSTRVLDGMLSPVVAYFSEREQLSDEDAKELQSLLDQYRKGRRGR